jgi:polysaccharide chain length determinant protein (PEP-CTERM system associated)
MEERPFDPLDYLSVVRRRRWWLIVPIVLCVAGGLLVGLILPREYRSEAEIGIAAPTLSADLLRGVSSLDSSERQRAISQQLLSRTVLERVVREENLSPGKPAEETAQALRGRVEENIVVPQPIGRGPKDTIDSFKLGYVDSSPERAQRVANRLATVFVEENSKSQTERAENTSVVLGEQARQSHERLAKLAEQLRAKKEAFMGRLPDQMNANIQMVNGLRSQLESISMQLRAEMDRLTTIDSQVEMMKQGIGSAAMTSTGAAAMTAAQSRVNDLRLKLTQAQAIGYTDAHPEVIGLKGELAEAQKDLTAVKQQSPSSREELLKTDPVYAQKLQERDQAQMRIKSLRAAESQARGQIAAYQSRVEAAPLVEQNLTALQQEHDLEKGRYTELTTKHQQALLAESLARNQGGERFSVLYPAGMGEQVSPKLTKLMALALGLGLVLGCVAVVGRELLDRSVHDARALQTAFDVPVLGEIPRIAS